MPNVEPTLLIGLGGTGREVLLRLRRRFFLAGYPIQPWISYLWVDTAARQPHEKHAKALPKDYVTRETLFSDEETCDIGVTQGEAMHLRDNKLSWMNVWEWAELEGVQPALEADGLQNGAKQQPPLGRLALFLKAEDVVRSLVNRLSLLSSATINERNALIPENLRLDLNPDAPLKIIFVGSLAGGTGAGCCIDLPAILKAGGLECIPPLTRFRDSLFSSWTYGFYLLPEAFCNDTDAGHWAHFNPARVRANGYAMLQELENLALRRGGGGQFLTGRENAGRVHATWLQKADVSRAKWIDAPLYNNIFLFDGYGDNNTSLRQVEDSYELVSSLLFYELQGKNKAIESAKANEEYQSSRGHIEMIPAEATDFKDAVWSDVFSFVFATAGSAQVTFDAPRLRQTAAYSIAERALRDWLGELELDPKSIDEVAKNQHARRMEQLTESLKSHLEEELTRKEKRTSERWSAVLGAKVPWKRLNEFKELKWPPQPGYRMGETWRLLCEEPLPFNAPALAQEMDTDLLYSQRLDRFLREIIDSPPKPNEKIKLPYTRQGGVRAAELCIFGANNKAGMIVESLSEFARSVEAAARQINQRLERTKADLSGKVSKLNEHLAYLEQRLGEKLFIGGARRELTDKVHKEFDDVHAAVAAFANDRYQALTYQCMADAWKLLIENANLKQFIDGWRGKLAQTRSYLSDLLFRVPDDRQSESGVEEILKGLRKPVPDALTKVLRPELHTDSTKLWEEIEDTYKREGVSLDAHIKNIQQKTLPAWRGKLKEMYDAHRLPREPGQYAHIVDLANDEAMPREQEKFTPKPNQLEFGDRLDALFILVARESFANKLLERENIAHALSDADKEFLTRCSNCRLDTYRKPNGEIHRKDDLIARQTGDLEPPKEHRHFHAPNGVTLAAFSSEVEAERLEVRAFRVELSIPLPALKVLQAGSAAANSTESYKLHFFKPKSGYMPIHRFDETEARKNRELYSAVILAVMLGQLRPSVEREGRDNWCYEWRVDANGRAQPNEYWRSLADIIRHLKKADSENTELFEEIRLRNEGFLNDVSPVVLLAIDLICQYNLSWIARQEFTFHKVKQKLKEQGVQDTESIFEPPSPQQLVLEAIRAKIADTMQRRWAIKLEISAIKTQDPSVLNTYELLNQFLHHFSRFVPAILKQVEQKDGVEQYPVSLLSLLSEVDMAPFLKAEEDLLLREPQRPGQRRNPVTGRLALKAPWVLYTPEIGAQTLLHHDELIGPDNSRSHTTMRPVERSEGRKTPPDLLNAISQREGLSDGIEWTREMTIADAWTREANLYPYLFKLKTLVGADPLPWKPWLKRRKVLAFQPMIHPPSQGLGSANAAGVKAPAFDDAKSKAAESAHPFDKVDLAPPFVGRYAKGPVSMRLESASDGYRGELIVNSDSYPIKATLLDGTLQGHFSQGAQQYTFQAKLNGTMLEVATGGKQMALERVAEGASKKNPLAEML